MLVRCINYMHCNDWCGHGEIHKYDKDEKCTKNNKSDSCKGIEYYNCIPVKKPIEYGTVYIGNIT